MQKKSKLIKYSYLKEFFKIILNYKLILIIIFFISIFNACISAYRPKLIHQSIDYYLLYKNQVEFFNIILIYLLILLLESLCHFSLLYLSIILSQNVITIIRTLLFKKLMYYKIYFFNNTPIGKIISYFISDIENINSIFNDGFVFVFGDILKIFMILFIMYTINNKLSIIVILTIPFIYIITHFFQKILKKKFKKEKLYNLKMNIFVQENIIGMLIIQLFNKEKEKYSKFKSINYKLMKSHIKTIFYFSIFFPIIEIISSLLISFIIFYGGMYLKKKEIQPGKIIAFIFFIYLLFRPIRQIADRFNVIQRGLLGIKTIFSLLKNNDNYEFFFKKNFFLKKKIKGRIIFDNVSFSYPENKKKILKKISFEIKPGEKIAILGKTGSGKSTITYLINRLYDVKQGNIYIDNYSIQEINLKYLRSHIRIIPQNIFLFNDTIYNNITLGNTSINIKSVIKMAKKIGIHDMIQSFPNGYHYIVKERGNLLSLGEKQLISFLRVQMHPYSILILDEVTSSLTNKLENLIQNSIINFTIQKKTSIIITHRISTLIKVDKIMVLNNGKIIEFGNHNDLIFLKNGYYKNFYKKSKNSILI